jgi:hypothetical protein
MKGLVLLTLFFVMIISIFRILFGLLFIISAILKLNPIEFFELVVLDTTIPSRLFAIYFSRLLIGLEFALGWLIIFNTKPKLVLRFSLIILIGFTLQTIFIWLTQGQNSNCGCFGIYLQFGPLESMLKNLLLIGLNTFLLSKSKIYYPLPKWLKITGNLGVLLVALPFVLFPPSWYMGGTEESLNSNQFPTSPSELPNNNHNIDYTKGEHLLAFFSTSCIHCLKASYELSITQKKIDLPQITVFFVGDKEVIPSFFEKSNSMFPFEFFEDKSFVKITEGKFPMLFHIKNGEVLHKYIGEGITINNLSNNLIKKNNQ